MRSYTALRQLETVKSTLGEILCLYESVSDCLTGCQRIPNRVASRDTWLSQRHLEELYKNWSVLTVLLSFLQAQKKPSQDYS